MQITNETILLFQLLKEHGHEAHVVGGCVRDSLMGMPPHDWDICTSAQPEQVKVLFEREGFRVLDTGLKHGTVTVMVNEIPFEITTYRIDGAYSDGRRPDSVNFTTDLHQDLARRDFTINSMAFSGTKVVDVFGGKKDIIGKTIRCVGDPDQRFQEDGLRILRALRFASTLGFTIEPVTAASIHKHKELLRDISAERIQSEFVKILTGKSARKVLTEFRDVFAVFIPEIECCFDFDQHNPYHIYDVWQHIVVAVSETSADPIVKLTMFFHDIGKPDCFSEEPSGRRHFYGHGKVSAEIADIVMRRLRFDKDTRSKVVELVAIHGQFIEENIRAVRRLLNKIGPEQFSRLLSVRSADVLAQNPDFLASRLGKDYILSRFMDEIVASDQCFQLKDLAVNGHDLIGAGIPKGKAIGQALNHLLNAVMDEKVPNEKHQLLAKLKEFIG